MSESQDNENPPRREEIRKGSAVWIIEKANYGTSNYTQGFVSQILTSSPWHPRGIKVRLETGEVGRVQWLMEA
ncbi:hypothetical protein COV04_04460 [Candidatus Uhrbacteria bacterium CG10_big_fil_rev_8_21_14_0_10_48_11]|uniref:YwbE family protein n=1 Tax=Candidatus Uhrbacteria bacterium CG10_big_fil_rev_8_21_14_0_10_48_11 TaxID=1975037 RepID=A0A2M8LDL3_9BACT|nr:MAG: hypothetical protein COV04_04460 [Candidatus Uhrbacteria bacterium CG10_big_fil_rev_8_21_14_0_10_48_11]